ncbi:MAG TPA: 50S ribosomal protein L23 [Alphaproteobacteria bacterium]|nr:50S ribosomal protein L23 [Alphaproteobacteria bacterium]
MAQNAKNFDVLVAPVITEKATNHSADNKVVFEVKSCASKLEIKQAVEDVFAVKVEAVNTIKTKGKTKRFRGYAGVRSGVKKAIIKLAAGQTIDFSTAIK